MSKKLSLSERFKNLPTVDAGRELNDSIDSADAVLSRNLVRKNPCVKFSTSNQANIGVGSDGEDLSNFDAEWEENFQKILSKTKASGKQTSTTGLLKHIQTSEVRKTPAVLSQVTRPTKCEAELLPNMPKPESTGNKVSPTIEKTENKGSVVAKKSENLLKKEDIKHDQQVSQLIESKISPEKCGTSREQKLPSKRSPKVKGCSVVLSMMSNNVQPSVAKQTDTQERKKAQAMKKQDQKKSPHSSTSKTKGTREGNVKAPIRGSIEQKENRSAVSASNVSDQLTHLHKKLSEDCKSDQSPVVPEVTSPISFKKGKRQAWKTESRAAPRSTPPSVQSRPESTKHSTERKVDSSVKDKHKPYQGSLAAAGSGSPLDELLPLKKRKVHCEKEIVPPSSNSRQSTSPARTRNTRQRHSSGNSISQTAAPAASRPLSRMAQAIHQKDQMKKKMLDDRVECKGDSATQLKQGRGLSEEISSEAFPSISSPFPNDDFELSTVEASFGFYKDGKASLRSTKRLGDHCEQLIQAHESSGYTIAAKDNQQSLQSLLDVVKNSEKYDVDDMSSPLTTESKEDQENMYILQQATKEPTAYSPGCSPDSSTWGSKMLFEGRTLLKGGVKPRHIPKTYVNRQDKDAPKDPRLLPTYTPVTSYKAIPLPPFAQDAFCSVGSKGEVHFKSPLDSTNTPSPSQSSGPRGNLSTPKQYPASCEDQGTPLKDEKGKDSYGSSESQMQQIPKVGQHDTNIVSLPSLPKRSTVETKSDVQPDKSGSAVLSAKDATLEEKITSTRKNVNLKESPGKSSKWTSSFLQIYSIPLMKSKQAVTSPCNESPKDDKPPLSMTVEKQKKESRSSTGTNTEEVEMDLDSDLEDGEIFTSSQSSCSTDLMTNREIQLSATINTEHKHGRCENTSAVDTYKEGKETVKTNVQEKVSEVRNIKIPSSKQSCDTLQTRTFSKDQSCRRLQTNTGFVNPANIEGFKHEPVVHQKGQSNYNRFADSARHPLGGRFQNNFPSASEDFDERQFINHRKSPISFCAAADIDARKCVNPGTSNNPCISAPFTDARQQIIQRKSPNPCNIDPNSFDARQSPNQYSDFVPVNNVNPPKHQSSHLSNYPPISDARELLSRRKFPNANNFSATVVDARQLINQAKSQNTNNPSSNAPVTDARQLIGRRESQESYPSEQPCNVYGRKSPHTPPSLDTDSTQYFPREATPSSIGQINDRQFINRTQETSTSHQTRKQYTVHTSMQQEYSAKVPTVPERSFVDEVVDQEGKGPESDLRTVSPDTSHLPWEQTRISRDKLPLSDYGHLDQGAKYRDRINANPESDLDRDKRNDRNQSNSRERLTEQFKHDLSMDRRPGREKTTESRPSSSDKCHNMRQSKWSPSDNTKQNVQNVSDDNRKRHQSGRTHYEDRKRGRYTPPSYKRSYSQEEVRTRGRQPLRASHTMSPVDFDNTRQDHRQTSLDISTNKHFELQRMDRRGDGNADCRRQGEISQGKFEGHKQFQIHSQSLRFQPEHCPNSHSNKPHHPNSGTFAAKEKWAINERQVNADNAMSKHKQPSFDPHKEDREFLLQIKQSILKNENRPQPSKMNVSAAPPSVPWCPTNQPPPPWNTGPRCGYNIPPPPVSPTGAAFPANFTNGVAGRATLSYRDADYNANDLSKLEFHQGNKQAPTATVRHSQTQPNMPRLQK